MLRLTQVVPQSPNMVAQLLGYSGNLAWKLNGNTLAIVLPDIAHLPPLLQVQTAGTVKLVGVQ